MHLLITSCTLSDACFLVQCHLQKIKVKFAFTKTMILVSSDELARGEASISIIFSGLLMKTLNIGINQNLKKVEIKFPEIELLYWDGAELDNNLRT